MRWTLLVVVIATTAPAFAQQPQMVGAQFDVVSIKPHKSDQPGGGTIESGGIQLDQLVRSLGGLAGGLVNNRTGLDGYYSVSLHYALPSLNADPSAPPPPGDDAPQFVTALQEQLGLKLVPEKTKVKILVVDHIERPTPD